MDHALLTLGHDLSTSIHMITHINFDFIFFASPVILQAHILIYMHDKPTSKLGFN
jgi:hypothetical protein